MIAAGETVTDVAARVGVSRKTGHAWLNKYEAVGWGVGRSVASAEVVSAFDAGCCEVALVKLRRAHALLGPRHLVHELARAGVEPVPSECAVYRALSRPGLIDPADLRLLDRKFKRGRCAPMELWQIGVEGGFALADRCGGRFRVGR